MNDDCSDRCHGGWGCCAGVVGRHLCARHRHRANRRPNPRAAGCRVALINLEGEWRLLTPEEQVELLARPLLCDSSKVREGDQPQRVEDWCADLVNAFLAHGEPVLVCLLRSLPSGAMRATIVWGEDGRRVADGCEAIVGPSDFREWG